MRYFRKYLLRTKFETIDIIGKIKRPILFCRSEKDELIAAIAYVKTGKDYKEEELGLDYSQKNARIRDYIKYYQNKQGDLNNYTDEYIDQDIEQILTNIKKGKESKNYLNIEERIAQKMDELWN